MSTRTALTGSILTTLGVVASIAGCSSQASPSATDNVVADERGSAAELRLIVTSLADPEEADKRYVVETRDGKISATITEPPPVAYAPSQAFAQAAATDLAEEPSKLDSVLDGAVVSAEITKTTDRLVPVFITFKETLALPRLPKLESEPLETAANRAIQVRRQGLIEQIRQARAPEQAYLTAELTGRHGARVKEMFWLFNGMVAELPLSEVRAVASRPDVQFVEPADKFLPAPSNQSIDARTRMNSDYLWNYETWGAVGLVDTGVRYSHTLLSGRIGMARDCFHGTDANCTSGTGYDSRDQCDHGTASASELAANSNLGGANRGVQALIVNSWKAYSDICGADLPAVARAISASVANGDGVIVVVVQDDSGGVDGAVSTAADAAFDQGAVVIAAAGNYGPFSGSVTAPGSARKVLAVGALDVTTLALPDYSGRGPTTDGRTKPDILGVMNVDAASNTSNVALKRYNGTSSATPNAAGLATGVWSYLSRPAPGIVYAAMLAIGANTSSPASDNNKGAGLSQWRKDPMSLYCGSRSVSSSTIEETVSLTTLPKLVDAAIWWPETRSGGYKNVDLAVVTPTGQSSSSSSINGVFEKVNVRYNLGPGSWKVRLVPTPTTDSRTVYWCMMVKY